MAHVAFLEVPDSVGFASRKPGMYGVDVRRRWDIQCEQSRRSTLDRAPQILKEFPVCRKPEERLSVINEETIRRVPSSPQDSLHPQQTIEIGRHRDDVVVREAVCEKRHILETVPLWQDPLGP